MFSQTPRKQTSLVDAAQTGSVRKPLLRQQPQTPRIAGTAPSEFTLLRSGSRAIKHADIISDELTATPVSSVRPLSTEPPASVGFRMRSTASASQLQQPQQTSFRRLLLGNEKRSMGILQSLPDTWFQYFSAMSDSGLQAHCGIQNIDGHSGFAYVFNAPAELHLWWFEESVHSNFNAAGKQSNPPPAIFVFPLPDQQSNDGESFDYLSWQPPLIAISPTGSPPTGGIIPTSASLMICTAEGSLRFWEDIRACGPQQFAQSKLNGVQWDDPISQLVPYEPHSYMAVTSGGQLFNVYVTMKGGVPVIQHRSISKPLNLFGKVSEWISGGGSASATAPSGTQSNQRVVSVSVGGRIKSGQPSLYGAPREIFIVTRSHLSCWSIGIDRPEKLLFEQDLLPEIRRNIAEMTYISSEIPHLSIIGASPAKDGRLVVLVEFSLTAARDKKSLALFWFNRTGGSGSSGGQLTVRMAKILGVTVGQDQLPFAQLLMSNGGPVGFVTFPSLIFVFLLNEDASYDEPIPFRSDSATRLMSSCAETHRVWGVPGTEPHANLWALCQPLGIVKLDVNIRSLASDRDLMDIPQSTEALSLRNVGHAKSILEQAIFFGYQEENPILFEIAADQRQQGFGQAALELSFEILKSSAKNLQQTGGGDLKSSLQERAQLLGQLVNFLDSNSILKELDSDTKFTLLWNAEKIEAASCLWQYHSVLTGRQLFGSTQPGSTSFLKIFEEIFRRFHLSRGDSQESSGYAGIKRFFLYECCNIGDLITLASKLSAEQQQQKEGGLKAHQRIFETNQFILAVLRTAYLFRERHLATYGIENDSMERLSWAAQVEFIAVLTKQFESTEKIICELIKTTHKMSVTETQEDDLVEPSKQIFFVDYTVLEDGLSLLRRQLIDLAEVLFSCFAERYQLKDSLTEQYRRQQEEVLLRLAGLGLLNNSFYLAEKYRDYRSMAILTHGYDQEAPAEQRISEYLKTYGKPFVYALYDWYLSKGMLKTLLTMGDVHAPLIAEYLAARGRDDIDWVHQLRYGKYQESTRSLQRYFVNEQRLHADRMSAADGRLLCSLGKLSSLCEQPISEKTLDDFDKQLDLLEAYYGFKENLLDDRIRLDSNGSTLIYPNGQLPFISNNFLQQRPLLCEYYYQPLLRRILNEQILSVEQLVDLMTLDYTTDTSANQFMIAADIVNGALLTENLGHLRNCIIRRSLLASCRQIMEFNGKMDSETHEKLRDLPAFSVLKSFANGGQIDLTSIRYQTDSVDAIRSKHAPLKSNLTDDECIAIIAEYENENRMLDISINEYRLGLYVDEMMGM